MWSRINKKRIENVLCHFENYIGGIRKQLCDFEMTCWALCGVETTQVKLKLLYCGVKVESRFACFYLTRQLEWKLRRFQLAEVVLVVLKPHVFNLTGQLVSNPLECSTLAATDLKAGERICTVLISAVGRPDFGYKFVEKMKKANAPMTEDVSTTVFNAGMFACVTSNWGELSVQYIVERG